MTKQFSLTEEQIKSFRENGYIGPFTLYEPEEMNEIWKKQRLALLDRSNAIYTDISALSGGNNIANYDRHMDNDFLAQHICRHEITDRVASLLGPDLICWRSEFFPKYPGDEGTDWHQADTFANASGTPQIVWPEDREYGGTITVWTAFTESNEDTGCLQFIPGTHNSMNYDETKRMEYNPDQVNSLVKEDVPRGFFGYDYRELQIDADWKPDESKAKSMVMRPGQFIIFWSTLMHASLPHNGKVPDMRLGYAARYVPSHVQVYPGSDYIEEYGGRVSLDKFGVVVVSGQDNSDGNRVAEKTTTGKVFAELAK